MADIFALADRFRDDLLARERQAAAELVQAYGAIWRRLRARLDLLAEQMEAARTRGEEISPAWLFQFERLQTLQRQVEAEIGEFARYAEGRIMSAQWDAVQMAQEHADRLLRAGLGTPPPGVSISFARLPAEAVEALVGFLQDGSPLRELLDELGPEAGQAARQALITGLATGQGVATIAQELRQALGGNLVRALTIARTEVLRAYREASRRTYEANRDVVVGWVWHSAANARTCAFCWAMHGTVHRLDERMATHPRCRCAMVPLTRSWRDLGIRGVPETRPRVMPGTQRFLSLSEETQRRILGPGKFAAWKAGALDLEDLVGFRYDPRWGWVGYERSLASIVGEDAARRWLERARALLERA